MKIGIAGPVSLAPIRHLVSSECDIPPTYSFPLIGILARELHELGHEVVIFAGSNSISAPVRFSGERMTVSITPRRKSRNAYDLYRVEQNFLRDAMLAEKCDLIHAHWTYEFASAALSTGIPVLITAHDAPLAIQRYFFGTKATFHWLCRLILAMQVLRKAKHLTAVSPYVANHLVNVLRVKAPVTVVPNGVNESLFAIGQRRLAGARIDYPVQLATVLEGFSERKNPKRALRAFFLLRKSLPGSQMRMFGVDFGPGEIAERWAKDNRVADGVVFAGKVPQHQLFESLSEDVALLFHPALEEAHPMAVCEAMALGLPVVGGKTSGGVPFTLDAGKAGLLVDVSNPGDMADALRGILSDPDRQRQIAQTAWHFAKNSFGLSHMVSSYAEIYSSLVPQK